MAFVINPNRNHSFTTEDGEVTIHFVFTTGEDLRFTVGDSPMNVYASAIRRSITAWEGVVDEDGKDHPVNEDTARVVISAILQEHPKMWEDILEAYHKVNSTVKN